MGDDAEVAFDAFVRARLPELLALRPRPHRQPGDRRRPRAGRARADPAGLAPAARARRADGVRAPGDGQPQHQRLAPAAAGDAGRRHARAALSRTGSATTTCGWPCRHCRRGSGPCWRCATTRTCPRPRSPVSSAAHRHGQEPGIQGSGQDARAGPALRAGQDRVVSEHEERLRAALRHGAGSPGDPQDPYDSGPLDTAGMLDRVRRGRAASPGPPHGRRRRGRRCRGGRAEPGRARRPGRRWQYPGRRRRPDRRRGLVQTVSAAGDSVWATVRVDCASGTCPALARSSDSGATWTVAAIHPGGTASQSFAAQHVELAGTAVDGWAWNQTELVATHDAGDSWARVDLPGGSPVSGVAAGSDRAVAFTLGGLATKQVLSVSEVSDDRWAPIPAAVRPDEMVTRVFAGGDMLGAVLGSRVTARAQTLLLAPPGAGWERHALPCRAQGEVFADTDGVTLWTACLGGGGTLLADSTDGNAWDTVQLPEILGRASMAARDDGSVLLAGANQSFVVDAEGTVDEINPPAGDPRAAASPSTATAPPPPATPTGWPAAAAGCSAAPTTAPAGRGCLSSSPHRPYARVIVLDRAGLSAPRGRLSGCPRPRPRGRARPVLAAHPRVVRRRVRRAHAGPAGGVGRDQLRRAHPGGGADRVGQDAGGVPVGPRPARPPRRPRARPSRSSAAGCSTSRR